MKRNCILVAAIAFTLCASHASDIADPTDVHRRLDRMIDSAERCLCNSAYLGINHLGKGADGDYAEYYGLEVVNLLQSDTSSGAFITYLLNSKLEHRKYIDRAIALEVCIVSDTNQKEYLESMLGRYDRVLSASKRRTLVDRWVKLIKSIDK